MSQIYSHKWENIADQALAKPDQFNLALEELSIYVTRKEKMLFDLWQLPGFQDSREAHK